MQAYRFPLPKMNASWWPLVGKHPKLHPFFEDLLDLHNRKTSKNCHRVTWNRLTFLLPRLSRHKHSICFEVDALLAILGPYRCIGELRGWGCFQLYRIVESYRWSHLYDFWKKVYPRQYQHLLRLWTLPYHSLWHALNCQLWHKRFQELLWKKCSGFPLMSNLMRSFAPVDRLEYWNSKLCCYMFGFFHPFGDTVDGRHLAPPGMYKTLLKGEIFSRTHLVDFSHQQ